MDMESGIFFDVSKAFDKVWQNGPIHKLRQNGVTVNIVNIIVDFLQSLTKYVETNLQNQIKQDLESLIADFVFSCVIAKFLFLEGRLGYSCAQF